MLKYLLLGILLYLGWQWIQRAGGIEIKRRQPTSGDSHSKYSKMDIRDAEFKDLNDDEHS